MTWFLDVGAVQIQPWLARSTDLKGRRGASSLLTELTGNDRWPGNRLPAGAGWNDQAGDVDGVVSLHVSSEEQAKAAARAVVTELRRGMPALGFEAVWAEGDSYIAAYDAIEAMRAEGRGMRSLPAVSEFPAARACQLCGQSPATATIRHQDDEDATACDDCRPRYQAAGHKGQPALSVAKVLAALNNAAGEQFSVPNDMAELSRIGWAKNFDAPTRIATIYADGNAVGAFLRRVANTPPAHGPDKASIVKVIDKATKSAFIRAVTDHAAHDGIVGVIPHVVGGDDLVVSVTARYAWDVVRSFIGGFTDHVREQAKAWGDLNSSLPTMSAGVVLHHHSYPIDEGIDLAGRCLKDAKAGLPKRPAVAYLDLDQDDPEDVRDADMGSSRRSAARSLQWLAANWTTIDSLARRDNSLRSTLDHFARIEDPAEATRLIRETCRRFDLGEVKILLGDDKADVVQLTDLRWGLQIARDLACGLPGRLEVTSDG